MAKESVLIRNEFFGKFLFSTSKACYLIPTSNESKKIVDLAFRNEDFNSQDISDSLKIELKDIGFDGNIRILDSPLNNRLSAPLDIYFDYTAKCNLSCPKCFNRTDRTSEMEISKISQTLKEIEAIGVKVLHLAGGEPTTNLLKLNGYLSDAKDLGFQLSMTSNGTLINDYIATLILEKDIFKITISLDGFTQDEDKKMRGNKKYFNRTIEGIKYLVSVRRRIGSQTKIFLKATYKVIDRDWLEKMIELSIALEVDRLLLNPLRNIYKTKHYEDDSDIYYNNLKIIQTVLESKYYPIKITPIGNPIFNCVEDKLPFFNGCISGQELLTIRANGDVLPCFLIENVVGNIYKESLLNIIKNSERLQKYQELKISDDCKNCIFFLKCRGGCRSRSIVAYNTPEKKDPLCLDEYLKTNNDKQLLSCGNHPLYKHFKVYTKAIHSL